MLTTTGDGLLGTLINLLPIELHRRVYDLTWRKDQLKESIPSKRSFVIMILPIQRISHSQIDIRLMNIQNTEHGKELNRKTPLWVGSQRSHQKSWGPEKRTFVLLFTSKVGGLLRSLHYLQDSPHQHHAKNAKKKLENDRTHNTAEIG